MKTHDELQAELDKIDAALASDTPREMFVLTSLEAMQAALCWALGQRDTAPTQTLE